ncbi:MAG TPA: metallophosphoesterase [Kineosporiaceae bacterium]
MIVIAHLSDLHLGDHLPAAAEALVQDVASTAPSLTLVTGDLTMRARRSQFRDAARLLDQLPTPRLVVPGNHDLPLDSPARIWSPYSRCQVYVDRGLDSRLEIPGLSAVALNSMPRWRWKSGQVSREQAACVTAVLRRADATSVRLVALHHPVVTARPGSLIGRRALLDAVVDARVDLTLAGHTHVPCTRRLRVRRGGRTHHVVEVVAGTATSRRDRGSGRSWSLIRVDDSTITIEERRDVGLRWRPGPRVEYPRDTSSRGS